MKKELFAATLLALILVLSLINTRAISSLCQELEAEVTRAGQAAQRGDWEESSRLAQNAMDTWRSRENYVRVVLRHTDIETLTDDFYELTEHIYTQDPGAVLSASSLVAEHLRGISQMERINLGSIF